MYQKVLVPLDGSELSETALEHLRSIVSACAVPEVVLLFVVETTPWVATGDFYPESVHVEIDERYSAWAKDYVANKADSLRQEGIPAIAVLLEGNAAEKILEYVEKNSVDLVIMSTHGRSGPARWLFGSVADRVVRHSRVPVLVESPKQASGQ
jgi:nucleotide-binding universal stress UspA family protein